MDSDTKTCSCGREFTPAQSTGDVCFRCKLDGINFGFRGVSGPGRQKFHDETIRSYIERSDANIRAQGMDPKKDFEGSARWV